ALPLIHVLNWRFRCTRVLNNIAVGGSQPSNARPKRGIPKSKRRMKMFPRAGLRLPLRWMGWIESTPTLGRMRKRNRPPELAATYGPKPLPPRREHDHGTHP